MPSNTTNLNLYLPDLGENGVADEVNGNFDTLDLRFSPSVGHTHDGTAGEGPKLPVTSINAGGTPDATTFLRGDGLWASGGGAGAVATDPIWDASGDLAVGTGANTAARLAIGTNGHVLTSNGATATWQAPSGGGSTIDPVTTLRISDDFLTAGTTANTIGALGWGFTGGALGATAASASHPGVLLRSTNSVINTVCTFYLDQSSFNGQLLASELFDVTWVVALSTNDTDITVRCGLQASSANPATTGVYLEKLSADTSWYGVTRAAGSQTRTAAMAATSTSFVTLRCRRIDASTIGFSVNAGTEVTLTTTLPTAVVSPCVQLINTAAANKQLLIDLFAMTISGLSR